MSYEVGRWNYFVIPNSHFILLYKVLFGFSYKLGLEVRGNGVERMKLYGILKDIMSFGKKYISFLDVTLCFTMAKAMLYEH